ncbi:MAG: HNH endonuclease signature motif containing protein [Hyphomicrobium sp.]|uniref:HNH endonuclease signature motif containing protein n=1 Tax=Hyphomicrobium sp. TaxID=82 RepID=UPI00356441FF
MGARATLTEEYVRQLLNYNHETGVFTWKERAPDMFVDGERHAEWQCRNWNSKHAGTAAGTINSKGYVLIIIVRIGYYAHRLAWLYMTGQWPEADIDHTNGDRSDNRFCNLREATHTENMRNARKRLDNTSGVKGVCWDNQTNKWRASIRVAGKRLYLGYFSSREDAAAAYERAACEHHGEFARTE